MTALEKAGINRGTLSTKATDARKKLEEARAGGNEAEIKKAETAFKRAEGALSTYDKK
jgi:hypothetical protein